MRGSWHAGSAPPGHLRQHGANCADIGPDAVAKFLRGRGIATVSGTADRISARNGLGFTPRGIPWHVGPGMGLPRGAYGLAHTRSYRRAL